MNIQLWYSKDMDQWRWTLSSEESSKTMIQESGSQTDLRKAMNDVATTVEYLLDRGIVNG
tara:strand:+ start:484 stop:663 length:180 start_codon:yes stop_codon:yes gene_type:complete